MPRTSIWIAFAGATPRGVGSRERVNLYNRHSILERAHFPRLCLTGGEPLLQAEGAARLVAEAHQRGMRVHLETERDCGAFRRGR